MRSSRLVPVLAALPLLAPAAVADVPVVELHGVVHAVSAGHVVAALQHADEAGAPLVVLRLDTPGGLDSSMRQIVDAVLAARTPVAAWVGPAGARAASAGFLILLSADVAAMAPGTNTGAATPVSATGDKLDEVMARKLAEDAAAYARGKAERRGRDPVLAAEAVTKSRSFTEREALEGHLIDLVANDVEDLLRQLDGREVKRFDGSTVRLALAGQRAVPLAMNWRQRVLSLVATPEVLFLLLLGALAGLGAELSHPGLIFPGVVGTLCLVLFLFATQIVPINAAGVLLILLAVGLFVAEAKVASYGLLTLGGIVAMILGGLMLVESPVPEMRVGLQVLLPATLAVAALAVTLVRLLLRSRRLRVTTGHEGLLGLVGRAETQLDPEGWVLVDGERAAAGDGTRTIALDPGAHTFEARRAGYEPLREERRLDPGAQAEVSLDASSRPLPGTLVIESEQGSAAIRVDGVLVARGRHSGPARAGRHGVQVTWPDGHTQERLVELSPGGRTQLTVAPDRPRPITSRWWFWAGVSAAVAGVVVGAVVIAAQPDPGPIGSWGHVPDAR